MHHVNVHVCCLNVYGWLCGCVSYVFIVHYMLYCMLLCQHTAIIIIPHWFVGDVILYIQVETTLLVRENLFDIIVEYYYNYRAFLLTLLLFLNKAIIAFFHLNVLCILLYIILAMDHACMTAHTIICSDFCILTPVIY